MATPDRGLRSSTAVRALPSTLASRAAPVIPPASQTYEPLVKSVLRHRLLFKTFVYSAIFNWVLVVLNSSIRQGGYKSLGWAGLLLNPVLPTTLLFSFIVWLFGVVPVIVMRKMCLTVTSAAAASPAKVFQSAMSKSSTIRAFVAYALSTSIITLLQVVAAQTLAAPGVDPKLSLFVKSKKHPLYLNGRLIYLVTSQLVIAALITFRGIQLDRFAVRWTSALSVNRQSSTPAFMLARVLTVVASAFVLSTMGIAAHALLFGVTRAIVLPVLFRIPIVHRILRPFTAHFLRGAWSLTLLTRHVSLIFRAWAASFMMIANWDFAESVFDTIVAEPVNVAQTTADPMLTLVSGITSPDPYFKHFAYNELQQLVSTEDESSAASARRVALFTDQKYNPSMWASLLRETLVTLGNDYQLFLRRGAPPAPAVAPTAEPPKKYEAPKEVPKATIVRTQVLKPARSSPLRSALDTIAADGSITSVLSTTAEAGASAIPELFRSVMPSQAPSVAAKAEAVIEAAKQSEKEMEKLVPSPAQLKSRLRDALSRYSPAIVNTLTAGVSKWWHAERVYRVVEGSLPNRKLDGLAIDALCSLVCASLTEDSYGVVQRDIPRVIEALLSFLSAIEDYRTELQTKYPPPTPEQMPSLSARELAASYDLLTEVARAGEVLSEVEDPLKEGIVRIVRTFGNKLGAFRFPPRTASKLQGFVDYN